MKADLSRGQAFYLKGGRHGCLLLHGFTGSAGHMRWLGEKLNAEGYTVSAPLLPGHGTSLEEMNGSNWHMWLACARTSYSQLRERCDTVSVIGLSMGGTLALLLAEEYPVDGLVCLAPAVRLRSKNTWLAPLVSMVFPYSKKAEKPIDPGALSDDDIGYDGMPIRRIYDLQSLIRRANANLFAVVAPTLIIQPVNDNAVDPEAAKRLYRGISSTEKEILWLQKSGHILTIGSERELALEAISRHLSHIVNTKKLAN